MEETKKSQAIIKDLKKDYDLIPNRSSMNYVKNFSIIQNSDNIRILFNWEIAKCISKAYLISYENAFSYDELNNYRYYSNHVKNYRNFLVTIIANKDVPSFIIRPEKLKDRFSNLFIGFDKKINIKGSFNRKFIIETESTYGVEKVINKEIADYLSSISDFYMESKDNIIMLLILKEQELELTRKLIDVCHMIDKYINTEA